MQAPPSNYIHAATEAVLGIHRAEVPGDVLVFLTGKSEVHECVDALKRASNTMAMRHLQDRLKPVPLFAGAAGAHPARCVAAGARLMSHACFPGPC